MRIFGNHLHHHENPLSEAPVWALELFAMGLTIIERQENMATKEQLDKLATDIAALIDAGVAEITAAVAAAQTASPDPAIDDLDSRVTAATQSLKDAAAKLAAAPTAP